MKTRGLHLLRLMCGEDAQFHTDQWESIDSILNNNKTLVVQKTGWGKSIVYFIATKLLREREKGPTLLISPLLALMRNQIEAAQRIGLNAETINSDNTEEWDMVEQKLRRGQCDILLLSPERLGNYDFISRVLPAIKGGIGILVVDEAHCISDWGHDFRPDYRRIVRIINSLPPNVPVLATTATANDRVIKDIKEQLGKDLVIIRGPLTRESLRIQCINLSDQAERLAWLYENITRIEGSGIIYCLTTADCDKVARWLRSKGVSALEYHSKIADHDEERRVIRQEREQMLLENRVKVLVATVALGMGYDKPDLSFVIHYQRPGNIVSYYQQIGRAGRKLDDAYAVLLSGSEDDEIQDYFIRTAFPTHDEMQNVINVIEKSAKGLKETEILKKLNMTQGRLKKCLTALLVEGAIVKENSIYSRTLTPWKPDLQRSLVITELRDKELVRIKEFVETDKCYMEYISKELDDPFANACGRCSNCLGKDFFSKEVSAEIVNDATKFLKGEFLDIKPRKMWPAGIYAEGGRRISLEEQNQPGKVLSAYGDSGWGKLVRDDKYVNNHFSDELVDASADLIINQWPKEREPKWVASVPSLRRPQLVKSFAERLAKKLGLPYKEVIVKNGETPQQKQMENSFMQCNNVLKAFAIKGECYNGPVLLIDDMIDSGWTLTVCGALLRRAGAGEVYPFALSSTTKAEGGE